MHARTPMTILLPTMAVLVLAGCAPSIPVPPTPTRVEAPSSAPTSMAAPAPASPRAVLAGRPLPNRSGLRVELTGVAVRDQVPLVTFTVVNAPDGSDFQIGTTFSDGLQQRTPDGAEVPYDGLTADGVYVLDTKNATRYLPGRASDGTCVCSSNLSSVCSWHRGPAPSSTQR